MKDKFFFIKLLLFFVAIPILILVKLGKIKIGKSDSLIELEDKAEDEFKKLKTKAKDVAEKAKPLIEKTIEDLTPRQRKIFEFIKSLEKFDISELRNRFKSVTVRTLRRDLKAISEANLIKKAGNTKGSKYELL